MFLYLHSEGHAESRKGDGVLSTAAPNTDEPRDIFIYDPETPVLAPGGAAALSGPFNQAQLELGNNLLVYTTPPLENPMHILGSPRTHPLRGYVRGLRRLHRQTGESAFQWPS